ncbi:restriction endonuclease subunit S [Lactobacillus sp. UMNPBX7]|nr:restriction endonuclease subunit S [Lactobacillus sp. UMNPBX7]
MRKVACINPKTNIPDNFKYVDLESVVGTSLIKAKLTTKQLAPSRAQRVAKKGDIFYQTVRPYQKNNFLFDINNYDFQYVFSTGYAQLRSEINNYFLFSYLQRQRFVNLILRRSTGTSYPAISSKDLSEIKIIFPRNSKEQENIGKIINLIDALITLQQRKLKQLKQLKKAMLQQLFVDKNCKQPILRFKNFNDNWEERKLSDIANYRNGKAHEQYIDMNGIYTVVNSKFISTNGKVKKFSNKPIELLKKGEIAFVLSDVPNGKALAKTYLIDSDNKYSLNQRIAGITPSSDINSYFLYILMNRNRYFLKFDDGVGQTNLSKKDIEKFKENYPLFDEQQKIANLFSKIQTLITRQQNKLNQLIALKKYLLQNLFI